MKLTNNHFYARGGFGGPRANYWSKDNVSFKINSINMKRDNKSSEIILKKRLGYGIYSMEIEKPMFMPKNVILGIFLYQDDLHELDIEFGRWGKFFNQNTQFVIQPNTLKRFFSFRKKVKCEIEWRKNFIRFTMNGKTLVYSTKSFKPGKEHFMINLWSIDQKNSSKCSVKINNLVYKK